MHWCLNPIFYDFYNDLYGVKEINSSFSRHLPFPGVYPWNIDNIPKYIGTFLFQAIGGIGSGIGHWVYDVMTICFLVCICCHFEYLNKALTDQGDNASILSGDLVVQQFKNKLRNCLIHHREILEFIEKLSKEMSLPLFIVCSQSTISLCLISLEVSTMKLDSSIESIMKASSLLEYWLGINIELSLYCYLGTKIQQLGLDIANAIYLCDWEQAVNLNGHKYDNSTNDDQKAITNINQMIQFSLMRAQKPIIFKGGLFYILSLETYKAVIIRIVHFSEITAWNDETLTARTAFPRWLMDQEDFPSKTALPS
ncbi:hypothetical protein PV326_013546 [Microctonus aethiopoides]|nr:hypothetical protein PV326_013546 [Microctonus aethiopoides]